VFSRQPSGRQRRQRANEAIGVCVGLCLPSCGLFRRNQVSPPIIAAPPKKPSKPIENPHVPPPPRVEQAATPAPPPLVRTEIPAKPPPAPPAPRPARRPRRVVAKVPPPAPVHTASAPPAASNAGPPVGSATTAEPYAPVTEQPSATVLTPVLSAGQQVAFNRAIYVAIDQAQSRLAEVRDKVLSQTQRANADGALSFIEQAQQLRASDLVTAKSLADRAVVLARALVAETR